MLIFPVSNPDKKAKKALRIPNITLSLLNVVTPPEHSVKAIKEEIENIDFGEVCDLVGIHPTVMPEEALMHADSVVIGEGEEVWPVLPNDFREGRLKKKYVGPQTNLECFPFIINLGNKKRDFVNVIPILTT
ncbi:MAG: hypothetical protein JW969_07450 [Spirochaetales bacterium]|nr:hypothetical protein [Spirochaetales bacterium]